MERRNLMKKNHIGALISTFNIYIRNPKEEIIKNVFSIV
jgi:hypothetical protein